MVSRMASSSQGLGRLRERLEYETYFDGTQWVFSLNSETHYIYDGRRVIQERDANNAPLVSYTRGTDLSGTLEGAGGIGGLLARSHGYSTSTGNWSTHNYYQQNNPSGNFNFDALMTSVNPFAA